MKKKDILVTRKHPGSTEPTKGPYLTTCTSSLQTLYFTQLIRWREIGQVGTSKYSNALIVFIICDQNQNNLTETTGVDQQNFNKGVQLMNLILCFHHSKLLPIFHFSYQNSCCNDMQHSTQIVAWIVLKYSCVM